MTFVIVSGSLQTKLDRLPDALETAIKDMAGILEEVAEETLLPMMARHYDASGLKVKSGAAKAAVSQAGAKGNVLEIRSDGLTWGVSYAQLPYLRFIFEGVPAGQYQRTVRNKRTQTTRTQTVRWKGIAPHPVIFLTADELKHIGDAVTQKVLAKAKA